MATIDQLKEQETAPTPLFLFDCVLSSGAVERFGTHAASFGGNTYAARVLKHNLAQLRVSSTEGLDASAKVMVTLANADSHFSEIERATGFRGAQVTIQFLFYDLVGQAAASESRVVFRGTGNTADEITEEAMRLTFNNRLNLQRIVLPEVQIQRRCPWMFPSTTAQRLEALDGGVSGTYSALYRCGYSPDQTGGVGSLDGSTPFTTCDYTRANCTARGMFTIGRFGGVEFVPPQILVRGFGQAAGLSALSDNTALYNDFVPLVYGTAWYEPPVVFARNDGNLTHMEVLLGMGVIDYVVTVVANDVQIPEGVSGADMTATGWFNLITSGTRSGAFNPDFTDTSGNPLGDPYGSMAMVSVVVPNRISTGQTLPRIQMLVRGLHLEQFDSSGASLGVSFTNNPAWVLLDVLRRGGWLLSDVDVISFATAAAYCAAPISTTDLYGNTVLTPRFQCNLVLRNRTSASEAVRGIRNGSSLLLLYGSGGLLTLRVENTLALQQATLPDGSNSTATLNGGWPAYEFSDASAAFSGILRNSNGGPSIRLYSQSSADTPNRLTVEFQDEYNEYQQDSLSLVDVDDALLTAREVTAAFPALGLPNFDQATRMLELQLAKSTVGSTFVEFQTTVKGVKLAPGDLITVTYLKEGLERQPFRVVGLAPGFNYQTVLVTAQWHDDEWYTTGGASAAGGRRLSAAEVAAPRPLVGSILDGNGIAQFGITEDVIPLADSGFAVTLSVAFDPPAALAPASVNIPLVSLNAGLADTGGTLAGGQTLYYAVSATDSSSAESALSFAVRATIPTGTNTNTVSLTGLSFSAGTAGFDVYRGANPIQLLRIAANQPVATSFTDAGATATLVGPPDANYDHANFYWRLELQPESSVGIHSPTTIGKTGLGMLTNNFTNALVRVTRGTGATQERVVTANDANTLTVTPPWVVEPDATSFFVVAEGTRTFGGLGTNSPVEFEVPNRPGTTVEISGRSANVYDLESAYELNPVTRWQIGGAGGLDSGTPPTPVFGLNPAGQGTIELLGIGFTTLVNTHTIYVGTLTLYSWNELNSPATFSLVSGIAATDVALTLTAAGPASGGDLIQIEGEILEVTGTSGGGVTYQVTRGSRGSTAAAHATSALVYHLTRSITIVPFVKDFFGSPASGSFSYSIFLPDARVGAAEFYVNNSVGASAVAQAAFGATVDQGLRTLAGGQISIQVQGYLAIQTNAAPPLVIEDSHAARDMFAVVQNAPSGGAIVMQVRQGSTVYCTLTIPDGATISNVVGGFGLPPLVAGGLLNLDITAVPTAAGTLPGRDLTVIIRL